MDHEPARIETRRRPPRPLLLLAVLAWSCFAPRVLYADELIDRARTLVTQGRHDSAIVVLEAAVREQPGNASRQAALADIYARRQHRDQAIGAASRALAIDSCQSLAHCVMVRVGTPASEGSCEPDRDSMLWHMRRAASCDSSNSQAWSLLLIDAIRHGREGEEGEFCREALRTGCWSPSELAYGRRLLAELPDRALMITDYTEVEVDEVCSCLQHTHGLRRDVAIVSWSRLLDAESRKALQRRWGLEMIPEKLWDAAPRPGWTDPYLLQVMAWLKLSGGQSGRPVVTPCVAPLADSTWIPRLERRALHWRIHPGAAPKGLPETEALVAGVLSLPSDTLSDLTVTGDWTGHSSRVLEVRSPRHQALASALLAHARLAGAGRADEAARVGRWIESLTSIQGPDSLEKDWLERFLAPRGPASMEKMTAELDSLLIIPATRHFYPGQSGVDKLPEAKRKVAPHYPDKAVNEGTEGVVVVQALVDESGRVSDACIEHSVPGLDEAALEAVRQWIFEPGELGGQPVALWVKVPIRFSFR